MNFDLDIRQDISGISVVIQFPAEEMDWKAVYTVEDSWPPFFVPFTYMNVDGQMECVYHIGNRSKLKFRFGNRGVGAYVAFWDGVLRPLIDCEDWFAKPYSFVMDIEHLYVNQEGQISYLYVPSLEDCSDFSTLTNMVTALSRENHVANSKLEVRVLQSIMNGFQPKAFLDMLHSIVVPKPEAGKQELHTAKGNSLPAQNMAHNGQAASGIRQPVSQAVPAQPEAVQLSAQSLNLNSDPKGLDEFFINLDSEDNKQKKKKEKTKGKSFFAGLLKKDKTPKQEIVLGAAGEPSGQAQAPQFVPSKSPQLWELPGQRQTNQQKVVAQPNLSNLPINIPVEDGEVTQLDEDVTSQPKLRLVGKEGLPAVIEIDIEPGKFFTIGRFDVSIGRKQSDFEFSQSTHAVSRHHAVIERAQNGSYQIQDVGSKAGTFVDGVKLTPNVPQLLTVGCRVSFGTSGAVYIWGES